MKTEIYCEECIISTKERRGLGTKLSPVRVVQQVFAKDGELLGELDPSPETFALYYLIHFTTFCMENKVKAPDKEDVIRWLDSIKNKS